MYTREEVLQTLKTLKPYLSEKYSVTELALFGSYSRNEQTEASDIDVMVEHTDPLGMKFLTMIYELEDRFKKEVQLVSKKGIKPRYFQTIQADLIYV